MATILLSAAGAALGSGVGGTVLGLSGAVIGRSIGASVGQSIDQRILGSGSDPVEIGKIDRFRVSGVGYGVPIQEVWGRMRVAGEIIWASRFMQSIRKSGGGKGNSRPTSEAFSYSVSIAIALCRGEATCIGRIWADGVEIAGNSLNLRFYPGSEDQMPDSKIEAVEGPVFAPSYRGICYVVIENLPLSRFGNRIPQFSFEVVRPAQGEAAEKYFNIQRAVNAVALIPGSGEYALATTPVRFDLGPGRSRSANVHTIQGVTDFTVSLNQLVDELPRCESVSLVVSWFGSDLRCGHCTIQPKVEQNELDATEMPWQVSGVSRMNAAVMPSSEGRPIYGGTPSDQSVVEAIRAIRNAGKEVMFYPFILMDQLEGNGLLDPWTGSPDQPSLPWRGRITLSTAPGNDGTPDQGSIAEDEIGNFLGSALLSEFLTVDGSVLYEHPTMWGYRRFILHYAHLCASAGGVETFCIGSELRGLTQVRSSENAFPMVVALRQLAAEVRLVLGSSTKISYAADWSEYFGYHVGQDVFFNLDPLWSDENVDFVGIDNYMPISDWRDGKDHADAHWDSIYNVDYLISNVAGGEGFDWYYDSLEGEAAQTRVKIVDAEYGEDWIFRYKDLRGWWSNDHHDRISGTRNSTPTSWCPGMKPIRFTEYGCAALDKATNQPNKFLDIKSSESSLPRASDGQRDDFIQMQYLHAMAKFWESAENNPVSDCAGSMVEWNRCHVWAWDLRRFPEFPANLAEWTDGQNYSKGHWLNGRSTSQQLASVISEACSDLTGDIFFDVSMIYQRLQGQRVSGEESVRSVLQSLSLAFSFDMIQSDGILYFMHRASDVCKKIDASMLVSKRDDAVAYQLSRSTDGPSAGVTRLTYIESGNDFEVNFVESVFPVDQTPLVVVGAELNLMFVEAEARAIVERWLVEARLANDSCRFVLPMSALALRCGNIVEIFDAKQVGSGWPTDFGCDSVFRWFRGGSTWLENLL